MDYDTVLKQVGPMGPYQIVVMILLGLCSFYNAFNTLGMNLFGPHHDHVCDVKIGESYSYNTLLQVAPIDPTSGERDTCNMLDIDWTNTSIEEVISWNQTLFETLPTIACHAWVFDREQYAETFTSEWSTVCNYAFMRQIFTNTYQGGLLVGSFVSGQIADRVGRKNTLSIMAFLGLVLGLSCVFNPEIYSFLVLRFLFSITVRGVELTSFVLLSEMLSIKWTAFAGIIIMFIYSLGGLTVAGLGFAISNFRWLQLSFLPFTILIISYYFYIPESPKWLIAKGRFDEVANIFKTMAKFNRKPYPEATVNQFIKQVEADAQAKSTEKPNVSIGRLFQKDLCKTTILIIVDWIALLLVYSAFTVSMNELAGSIYTNIILACTLELPGYFASIFVIRRWGRRRPVIVSFGLAAVMNLVAVFMQVFGDLSLAVTILSLVCRAALSSIYGMFYIYGALLFPTEVRQIALGFTIAIGSAFGLAAPYIIGPVAQVWTPLPNIIFGAVALVAMVATVFLPDLESPESTEDEIGLEPVTRTSLCEDIPITNSGFTPAAACVPIDVYPITSLPPDEEVAADEFTKKNVVPTLFKESWKEKESAANNYINGSENMAKKSVDASDVKGFVNVGFIGDGHI